MRKQADMVRLDGGRFFMGSDTHYPEEKPLREVDDFRDEISRNIFLLFLTFDLLSINIKKVFCVIITKLLYARSADQMS